MSRFDLPATSGFYEGTGGTGSIVDVLRGLDKAEDGSGNVILMSEFDIKENTFAFNSSSPKSIASVINGERVKKVVIEIVTPFDAPEATISVGHTGSPAFLMDTAQNIPSEIGVYEVAPSFKYGGDDTIKLYISPGGSSQGTGLVYLETERNDI